MGSGPDLKQESGPHGRDRQIEFTVDTEELSTSLDVLTPRQIMTLAKIDPDNHYLTEIKGRQQVSFDGKPDEPIPMHNEMVFVSAKVGPTPVS